VKLKIGGGKERMASLAGDADFLAACGTPASEEAWKETVAAWHKRKTAIYEEMIVSGAIPARPGVKRLSEEAHRAGWLLAVCSTSAVPAVQAVLNHVMGEETAAKCAIFAGDMVKAKKPAPDVYLMAVERLGVAPERCIVIEDSRNGLLAAKAAGMRCLVTVNELTKDEGFAEADLVLSCLGDPGGEKAVVIENRSSVRPGEWLRAEDLERLLTV
jgi:HAD superfamily hydrolase (TIGR01509 family)